MNITIQIDFFSKKNFKREIKNFFKMHDIALKIEESDKTNDVYFIAYVKGNVVSPDYIEGICEKLQKIADIESIGDSVHIQFNNEDFDRSPLFHLKSTGNSPKAFLEDKGKGIEWVEICGACGLKAKNNILPLP